VFAGAHPRIRSGGARLRVVLGVVRAGPVVGRPTLVLPLVLGEGQFHADFHATIERSAGHAEIGVGQAIRRGQDVDAVAGALRQQNGANSPSPARGFWSGRMPTVPPAASRLYSVRTPAPSARTCSGASAPRTLRSRPSTAAMRGGRYRIAIGVLRHSQ